MFLWTNWLIPLYFVLIVVVMIVSWLCNSYYADVRSVITYDGIRWLFSESLDNFRKAPLAETVLIMVGLSVLTESGFVSAIFRRKTLKQRKAMRQTVLVIAVAFVLLAVLALPKHAVLRNVFGGFESSPLTEGMLCIIFSVAVVAANVYGFLSGRMTGFSDFVSAHSYLLRQTSHIFIIAFEGSQLIACLRYSRLLPVILQSLSINVTESYANQAMGVILYWIPLFVSVIAVYVVKNRG